MAKLSVEIIGNAAGLTAAFAEAGSAAEGFGAKMQSAGSKIAGVGEKMTLGITVPLALIGAASVKMASSFQASMELIHTQAGAAQSQVDSLSSAVLKLAGPTATAPEELAKGLFHLESQGLRGAQAMDALRIAAEGAKVGQANLEDVTNALGAALVAGVKGTHNMSQAMGVLNATVGAGDMRMQDLADAMGTGLPAVAALAGVSLRDVGAALAVFGDNNIRGAKAGTLLNSTLRLMEAPSKAAAKALATVGLGADALAKDLASGGIPQAVGDLIKHMQAAGLSSIQMSQLLSQAFGGKQSTGIKILVDQFDRLKQKELEVAAGANKFGADWTATTQTTAFHTQQMKASFEAAAISLGNILLPIVTKVSEALARLGTWLASLSPQTQKLIAIGIAVAAALGPAVAIIGALVSALGTLAVVVGAVASPIGIVVVALAAFGVAMAAAVLWPDKLKAALEQMGLSAQQASTVVADLRTVFFDVAAAATAMASEVQAHWGEIKATISTAVNDIKAVISAMIETAEALWKTFGSTISTIAKNDFGLVVATVKNAMTEIRGVIEIVSGLIHGDWGKVWDGLKTVVSGAMKEVEAVLKNAASNIAAIAALIGRQILNGIEAGMKGLVSKVEAGLQAIGTALKSIASQAYGWALAIGKSIVKGVADGIISSVGGAIAAAGNFVNSVKSRLEFWKSPADAYGKWIGGQLATGIADGIASGTAAAAAAGTKLVGAVKSGVEAAAIPGSWASIGDHIATSLGGGISAGNAKANKAGRDLIGAAESGARAAIPNLDTIGQNAGQSFGDALVAGVEASGPKAAKAVTTIIGDVGTDAHKGWVAVLDDARATWTQMADIGSQIVADAQLKAWEAQEAWNNYTGGGQAPDERPSAGNTGATAAPIVPLTPSTPPGAASFTGGSGGITPGPQFAMGGVVPGPINMPVVATVHGGETIIPVGGRAGGNTVVVNLPNLYTANPNELVQLIKTELQRENTRGG